MEVKEYCDSITAELSGWKSKMDSIASKFDSASSGDKKKIMSEVNELHAISSELGRRIEGLKQECLRDYGRRK